MRSTDHLSLRLIEVGAHQEWACPRQGLTFVFTQDGSGRCCWGNTAQGLATRDVLVLSKHQQARIVAGEAGLRFWCTVVSLEQLLPLFAAEEIQPMRRTIEGLRTTRFIPAGDAVADHCHELLRDRSAKTELERRGQVLRLACSVLGAELGNDEAQKDGYISMDEHVNQCLEALSVDDLLTLSVGALAKRFGCSRRHLNRLFHHHFGLPVASLRMELRLLKAVSLLRDPTVKIIPVAEQCGFNHLGLFNTCFKRRFGITPGQWRKHAQEPAVTNPLSLLNDKPICKLADNGLCPWHCKPGKKAKPLLPQIAVAQPHQPNPRPGFHVAAHLETPSLGNRNTRNGLPKLRVRLTA